MSHPNVRRLTAAALLVALAAVPALAAPGSARDHRPQASRVAVLTGVPMLDRLLDWLGLPAAGVAEPARGVHGKSVAAPPRTTSGVPERPAEAAEHGGMIDPNG